MFHPTRSDRKRHSPPASVAPRLWPAVFAAAVAATVPGCADRGPPDVAMTDPSLLAAPASLQRPGQPSSPKAAAPVTAARPPAPGANGSVVDLSTPRGAMTTYYRALAAGDATAAKEAVAGDELAFRYIDAVTAYTAGANELANAVATRFGPAALRQNPALARSAAAVRAGESAWAIEQGEARVSGDIAIVTPRLPAAGMDATTDPLQPTPGVLRNTDGRWRLLVGAMRRTQSGRQGRDAETTIDANTRSGRDLRALAAAVTAGKYKTPGEVWGSKTLPEQLAAAGIGQGIPPTPIASPPQVTVSADPPPAARPPVSPPEPTTRIATPPVVAAATTRPAVPAPQTRPANPPVVAFAPTTGPAVKPPATLPAGRPDPWALPVATTTRPAAPPAVAMVPPKPVAPAVTRPAARPPAPAPGGPADPQSDLAEAVVKARLDMLRAELAKGADINAQDPLGRTHLHRAAIGGETEIALFLLDKGADLEAKDGQGWTALHWAASSGKVELAKLLIEKGAKVDARAERAETPLHWASIFDRREVADVLLSHAADPNARDAMDKTPLHAAVEHDARAVAALLLSKGADPVAADKDGFQPLHSSLLHTRKAITDLAAAPADPTVSDPVGGPADVLRHGRDMIDLLLAYKADVNAKTPRGATPLHLAAWDSTRTLAEALIAKGANLSDRDIRGKTPLILANEHGQKEVAAALTAAGAKE